MQIECSKALKICNKKINILSIYNNKKYSGIFLIPYYLNWLLNFTMCLYLRNIYYNRESIQNFLVNLITANVIIICMKH